MGKMKNLVIEQEVMAQILKEAVESGDYIVCDRCELVTPADQMFGPVCHDCAMDLVEDGLAREEDEMVEDILDEIIEDLLAEKVAEDFCKMLERDAGFFHDTFF